MTQAHREMLEKQLQLLSERSQKIPYDAYEGWNDLKSYTEAMMQIINFLNSNG